MKRQQIGLRWILVLVLLMAVGWAVHPETIRLPGSMTSFNQNYTDGPGAWGECGLGTGGCPDQICTTGCLVTAFASVLDYLGVSVEVAARQSCNGRTRSGMDPGLLNDWLRLHGGFGACAGDPMGSCCLVWSALPGPVELTFYSNRSEVGINPVAAVVIDHALRGGHPVIAGVHWDSRCHAGTTQSEDCHWIILTGKAGDTYTILDPMNLDATDSRGVRTTLDRGTRGSYIIDRFVVVTRPDNLFIADTREDDADFREDASETVSFVGTAIVLVTLLALIGIAIPLIGTR